MRAADNFTNVGKNGKKGANEALVYDTLVDAGNEKLKLKMEVRDALSAILQRFNARSKSANNLDIDVWVPENLADEGLGWTFDRILAVAFTMGTAYNRSAVMEGYNLTDEDMTKLANVLTEEDWAAVQEVWDLVNSHWDALAEVYERLHGIRPAKVEATPVIIGGKEMRGGYYPLRFDPLLDQQTTERSELQDLKDTSNAAFPAATASGFMKKRRGTGGKPVLLSMGVLLQHLDYVTTYITHAEAIRDIDRILAHKDYSKQFKRVFGHSFYKGETSLRRLLKDIVNVDREQLATSEQVVRRLRNGATRFILGLNPSVAVKQIFSLPGFVKDIGGKTFLRGVQSVATMGGPMGAYRAMMELSPAMAERSRKVDRDMATALVSKDKSRARAKRDAFIFFPIHLADATVVVPAWWGGYLDGMDMFGGDATKAVAHADKLIAASQPFNRTIDMSYHQRSNKGIHNMLTMFSSFTMKYGNRVWLYNRGFLRGQIGAGEFIKHIAYERLAPPLMMSLLFTALTGDEPDAEDLAIDVLMYQFLGIPLVREISNFIGSEMKGQKGRDIRSPALIGVEVGMRNLTALFALIEDMDDEETRERAEWALFDLLSISTGVPASRVAKKVQRGAEEREEGEGGIGSYLGIINYNRDKE